MNGNNVALADTIRQIGMEFGKLAKNLEDLAEHRYEEYAGEYKLRTWYRGRERTQAGELGMRPEWLANIINVAIIGEHAKHAPEPPPNLIVWFRTNADDTLASFVDFMNQ